MNSEIVRTKRRIRCRECLTVQGTHKKSCSKSKSIATIRIIMILRQYPGLKQHEIEDLFPVKRLKLAAPNGVIQRLRSNGFIKQEYGKYFIHEKIKDPDFFSKVCNALTKNPRLKFKEVI